MGRHCYVRRVLSTWQKDNVQNDAELRFAGYLNVTADNIDNVLFATANYDGSCRADVVLDPDKPGVAAAAVVSAVTARTAIALHSGRRGRGG